MGDGMRPCGSCGAVSRRAAVSVDGLCTVCRGQDEAFYERIREVDASVRERGNLTAEDCMQLLEAGINIYAFVVRADVEAGAVTGMPPELLSLI